jgi:hypothetical protein
MLFLVSLNLNTWHFYAKVAWAIEARCLRFSNAEVINKLIAKIKFVAAFIFDDEPEQASKWLF